MNIGFVSTRLAGTHGVSLEPSKLATILGRMGRQVFYCAGELDPAGPLALLVPEMHFAHSQARAIHDEAFAPPTPPGHWAEPSPRASRQCLQAERSTKSQAEGRSPRSLRARIATIAAELNSVLTAFVDRFSVEVLLPENALVMPMHIPLGVALTEFIAQRKIPTIAHHHDFHWERDCFANARVPDILDRCFPPDLPCIRHLVISSPAHKALLQRRGVSAWILPSAFNFKTLPPAPDS